MFCWTLNNKCTYLVLAQPTLLEQELRHRLRRGLHRRGRRHSSVHSLGETACLLLKLDFCTLISNKQHIFSLEFIWTTKAHKG